MATVDAFVAVAFTPEGTLGAVVSTEAWVVALALLLIPEDVLLLALALTLYSYAVPGDRLLSV
jgi:hypothetical protein